MMFTSVKTGSHPFRVVGTPSRSLRDVQIVELAGLGEAHPAGLQIVREQIITRATLQLAHSDTLNKKERKLQQSPEIKSKKYHLTQPYQSNFFSFF
ncbi:MAG TPA: hypothetical protein VI457_12880 [Methylococcaceae bacterium]|nr:hypothetical protein [Methylococcaceae bacterium]